MKMPPFRFVLVLVALIALTAGYQYVSALRGQLAVATSAASQAKQDIGARDAIIERLLSDARDKDRQREQLDRARGAVDAAFARYQKEFRRLIDENAAVRAWAASALPDDVVRLHASPALTGADDYARGVPAGSALHDAGDVAAHEWRAE
jgi:LysB family phage lysis regulatory protein